MLRVLDCLVLNYCSRFNDYFNLLGGQWWQWKNKTSSNYGTTVQQRIRGAVSELCYGHDGDSGRLRTGKFIVFKFLGATFEEMTTHLEYFGLFL